MGDGSGVGRRAGRLAFRVDQHHVHVGPVQAHGRQGLAPHPQPFGARLHRRPHREPARSGPAQQHPVQQEALPRPVRAHYRHHRHRPPQPPQQLRRLLPNLGPSVRCYHDQRHRPPAVVRHIVAAATIRGAWERVNAREPHRVHRLLSAPASAPVFVRRLLEPPAGGGAAAVGPASAASRLVAGGIWAVSAGWGRGRRLTRDRGSGGDPGRQAVRHNLRLVVIRAATITLRCLQMDGDGSESGSVSSSVQRLARAAADSAGGNVIGGRSVVREKDDLAVHARPIRRPRRGDNFSG